MALAPLSTGRVKDMMDEPSNRSNSQLMGQLIAERLISEKYLNTAPPAIKDLAGSKPITGSTSLGQGANPSKTFTSSGVSLPLFVPDASYWPGQEQNSIDGAYNLTSDITVGTFIGAKNSSTTISHLPEEDKKKVIMNLYLQAEILKAARSRKEFQQYRIEAQAGVYRYGSTESRTVGSIADLRAQGRATAYDVRSYKGNISSQMVFILAQYLLTYPFYEKIIMDYNTFDGQSLDTRVWVITPDMTSGQTKNIRFNRETETRFNGAVISGNLALLDT